MSEYADNLRRSLWHGKAATRCLEKACASLGVDDDDDEPVEEGLIEPPPPDDVPDSGFLPALFDDELEDNPQGKRAAHLRLIKSAAVIRGW